MNKNDREETEKQKIELHEVIGIIEQADDIQIQDIIQAVIRRYEYFFPDWEVGFVSFHKEPKQRRKDLKSLFRFMKKHYM